MSACWEYYRVTNKKEKNPFLFGQLFILRTDYGKAFVVLGHFISFVQLF